MANGNKEPFSNPVEFLFTLDPNEMLTPEQQEAANALLKSLMPPPEVAALIVQNITQAALKAFTTFSPAIQEASIERLIAEQMRTTDLDELFAEEDTD